MTIDREALDELTTLELRPAVSNLASSQAFRRGGAVHVLERSHIPLAADMAAIFRYWSPDRRAETRSRRYVSW